MRYQTSRAIRAKAATIGENIASMTASYNAIAAQCGWDDPRLDAIDRDIAEAQRVRKNLIARANSFNYTPAA